MKMRPALACKMYEVKVSETVGWWQVGCGLMSIVARLEQRGRDKAMVQ